MIVSLLTKIAFSIVTRLVTERVFSEIVIQGCRAWADKTENKYDDRVIEAMAKALDIAPTDLPVKPK